jgi:hypothetical protein
MYNFFLILHNLIRWLVILAAAWAIFRAYLGWLGKRVWTPRDRQAGMLFSIAYDVQLLFGIVLAFISPLVRTALRDFGAAIRVEDLRIIVVEHIPLMLISLVIVHATSMIARRASDHTAKHRISALGYSLATLIVLIAIPWGKPLLRGLG